MTRLAAASPAAEVQATTSGLLMGLFLFSLLLPINLHLGSIRMDPSRLFLTLAAIPFGLRLFGGRLGGFTWVDGFILIFTLLIVATLYYHHGMVQLSYALSQFIEMFGGYMAGRVMIRSLPDYRRFVRYFLVALAILLPFSIIEMVLQQRLILDILGKAFDVIAANDQYRLGLKRVQSVFPHPILYGLFCSMALASVFYLYRGQVVRRVVYMGLVISMTFMSLSSAPGLAVLLQLLLIAWNRITHGAWWTLIGIFGSIFAVLQLFTHRGAMVIFVQKFTLDPATGWNRILIWQFGSQNVAAHPWLGIGMNDWVRPYWMHVSFDNFWLLMALRYGLPSLAFLSLAYILHVFFIVRAKNLSEEGRLLRLGYMITLSGLIFTLFTVDIWDAVQVFVFFFLGAGAFLYTSDQSDAAAGDEAGVPAGRRTETRYSRFPQTAGRGHRRPAAEKVRPG